MAILCAVLKYKIILPMLVLAVIAVTVKLNQKLLRKWKNKPVAEVEKYSLKDKEVQKLSGYFVDQEEQYVSSLGNGYIMNYLVNGSLSRGFAVVSDKRVYFRGSCFSGQGKSLVRTDEERTVDIKDVTGSGFIYKRYLGILIALFMAVVTLISGVCGTAYAASVEWAETIAIQRTVEELEETVSKVKNSEKTIAKLEKQIAKKDEAVQEEQEKLAELKAAQQQVAIGSRSIYEVMDDIGFSAVYEDHYRSLKRIFEDSVLYDRMLTMYDELLDGEPIEYYEGTEFYDSLSKSCYEIRNYLNGSLWQTVNEADSRIEAMLPSKGGIYLSFYFVYEKCGLSWDTVQKANLSAGVLSEYPYLDMKYFWENGYLEEDFTPVYIEDYQWDEDMEALNWQFEQEYLNLLSKIAPDYLEQATGRADFAEYIQNINSFGEFYEYYSWEEYNAFQQNIPSLEELVMNYPGMNYAAEFGGVETPYDADVEKAEEKLRTLENEKAELEEELLEVQELAADASRYENRYHSNKQESFITFVLSAVSAAAAGLLLTFAISCLLIFADYLKKRKTMFQIQYAGGCIAFDVSFYAKAEIEDFQKQLRRTKDHVADTATVKTVTVNAPTEAPAQTNVPDELRKYAELLKDGLISQEEYDTMKKKLLGL